MKLYLTDKIAGDVGGGEGHETSQLDEDALLAPSTNDFATNTLELACDDFDLISTLEGIGLTIEAHDVSIVGVGGDDKRTHLTIRDGQWRVLAKGVDKAVIVIETEDL